MKKLIFMYVMMLFAFKTMANEPLFFYPIAYEEQTDLFIKLAVPVNNAFIQINDEKHYFQDKGLLLKNISTENPLLMHIGQTLNGADLSLLDEGVSYHFNSSTSVIIDAPLYKALTGWSTTINQTVPLNNQLLSLLNKEDIAPEELLSFTQQFYKYKAPISKMMSVEENINAFFNNTKASSPKEKCDCNFVLNHYASVSPLKQGAGSYGSGYYFLNYGNTLSEIIPSYSDFNSNSPKWHRWYSKEKGPAHDNFLRTYDSGSSFNYQWSTLGMSNSGNAAPSPSFAYNTFQFMCVNQEFNLPDDCACTKKFCTLYEYNNFLKVIARKLKPLSNVSSTAEELAVVTIHNNDGVKVVDAQRNRAFTECKGNFNFEFISNLFDLAETVVGVVVDVQDNTNGPPINDVPGAIADIGDALIELFKTPPVLTTGNCEDVYMKGALLRDFECFELKTNDPTTITLQSFTFLGVAGDRKWDNYAIARSDFRLQSIVLTGSVEGKDHCCSDKLGQHLYANMGGPINETTHNSNVTGAYYLFGPWDNFTPVGYAPVIPMNANRGYFSYNDKTMDCAPIKPKNNNQDLSAFFSAPFEEIILDSIIDTDKVLLESETKIESNLMPSKIAFDLYPNPTHDYLNIDLKNLNPEAQINLSIYNALGQLVEVVYDGDSGHPSKNITWSNNEIPNGTYHLVLRENNILIFGKAFVYNK